MRAPAGVSDPEGVRAWARTVAGVLARVEVVVREAEAGVGPLSVSEARWFGRARHAYDAAVARGAREQEAWCGTLRWVAQVLFAYADEVAALQGEFLEVSGDHAQVAGGRAAVRARLDAAGAALAGVLHRACEAAPGHEVGAAQRSAALTVSDVAAQGDGSDDVAAWWRTLPPERRAALAVVLAPVLGAAGGLPAAVRDRGNRAVLQTDLAVLGTRGRDGRADADDQRALRNARAVQRALLVPAGDAATTLWRYGVDAHDGDGVVAVGVGDLDGATHVAVLVPGVGTEVEDAREQVDRVQRLVDKASGGGAVSVAGLQWLGYDAPDHPGDPAMLTPARAREGAEQLRGDVEALAAARDDEPRVTVLGHSYGSTVVAEAARGGMEADAVALLGSPGAGGARTADELGVDEVYVARDSRDLVATLGDEGAWGRSRWAWGRWRAPGLGVDPSAEEFGAVRLRAERPGRGPVPSLGEAHSGYLDAGSESLGNLGAVVAGDLDRLGLAEASGDRWWSWPYDPEWGRTTLGRGL